MGARDLKSNIGFTVAKEKAATTSTDTSAAIDLIGFQGCVFVIDSGLWTDGTHTFTFTECDTSGGTYTTVAAADLDGTGPVIDGLADDNTQNFVGYKGQMRFVKVVQTVAAATTGLVVGSYVIKGYPKDIPQN